ncbi:MAG: Ig-like domain-containing protein [Clostridia bacterium]|nr:Ig-like domain-containing protein [Clostridia bacterium]
MADKNISQKKRIALFIAMSALAMIICLGVVMGVAVSLMTDGVYEFPENEKTYAVPSDGKDTVSYVIDAVKNAVDGNTVYVNTSTAVDVSDLTYSGSDSEMKLLRHMKGKILGNIDAMYPEDYTGSFANGFTDYPVIDLSGVKVTDAHSEADGTKIRSVITTDKFIPAFDPEDDTAAVQKIKEEFADAFTVITADTKPAGVEISSEIFADDPGIVNAGRISSLNIKRIYSADITVEFQKDLSSLGKREFKFSYSVTEKYSYTWAGISCTEEMVLLPGEEKQLSIKATLNDYSDYETRFVSGNEAVATIDDIGYIKAVSGSAEPAIITVYLDYLGHEYSSQCKVYVGTPVKAIDISDKKLTIGTGESAVLTAELSPENATNKNIIWITDDENIVTVENGTVTAVSAGETVIRAVAEDGDYQAICTVTVS